LRTLNNNSGNELTITHINQSRLNVKEHIIRKEFFHEPWSFVT